MHAGALWIYEEMVKQVFIAAGGTSEERITAESKIIAHSRTLRDLAEKNSGGRYGGIVALMETVTYKLSLGETLPAYYALGRVRGWLVAAELLNEPYHL